MRVYDEYERRFALARVEQTLRFPLDDGTRENVRARTKAMLRWDDALVPRIHGMETVSTQDFPAFTVSQLRYRTWERVWACASLYLPKAEDPLPLVFLFCGHGDAGRLTKGYVTMAQRLAKLGLAVLVPDNIGQGDRTFMGHRDVVSPFRCGLTLQGMIVMESVALIRYMREDPRFDPARFGSCGNSGGGTLNVFLAALAPELSALSASGYPSEFPYVLAKERFHCACNLLPGSAHGPEMWEILSLFAPKPLFLEQGQYDNLIPYDLAQRNARKVGHIYRQMGAEENFGFETEPVTHSWTPGDRYRISRFLAGALGGAAPEEGDDEDPAVLEAIPGWHLTLPEGALTTDQTAERLSGKRFPAGTALEDIFPPQFEGKRLCGDSIIPDIGRGPVMRVLAQMECTLEEPRDV